MSSEKNPRITVDIETSGEPAQDRDWQPVPILTQKDKQDIISVFRFFKEIPDEVAAVAFMEHWVWGDTPWCPYCGSDNIYRTTGGKPTKSHRCRECRRHFSVRTCTVMKDTNLPVQTWLFAIHTMLTGRFGTSGREIAKMLDVTPKTAWHLCHRIREAMQSDDVMLSGEVQVDETFVGGKEGNKHANKKIHGHWSAGKKPVFGAKESGIGGKVIAFPTNNTLALNLQLLITDTVEMGSTVFTDGYAGYKNLPRFGYQHESVNHSIGEYVRDDVTTNAIESFWAIVKRSLVGTYMHVEDWHLFRYMYEYTYRQNHGEGNGFESIGRVLQRMVDKRLTYDELAAEGRRLRELRRARNTPKAVPGSDLAQAA